MSEAYSAFSSEPRPDVPAPEPITVCKCITSSSTVEEEVSERKEHVLSAVWRAENYLRLHRIPELTRFILTKIICNHPINPAIYGVELLEKCMMFRAHIGPAPVLYEDRHLEAVVKSFDPGNRGWLSAGQFRRAFAIIGLIPEHVIPHKIPTDKVLRIMKIAQERELFNLLSAGVSMDPEPCQEINKKDTINIFDSESKK